ncbi:hypothetical protein M0657_005469 [Pyricularia oryzae]|uniref:Uncharacterized protein n=1 Tax=Pyricularia oryzae TaxID=318829 RepID=A0A4V1C6F4_PYROR|nr:hypothetical protein M0657_005469 [Pyricularia oryzae]QBZ59695.1 hypothetical protein PoMZ_04658 [Pyricularia oryzae]
MRRLGGSKILCLTSPHSHLSSMQKAFPAQHQSGSARDGAIPERVFLHCTDILLESRFLMFEAIVSEIVFTAPEEVLQASYQACVFSSDPKAYPQAVKQIEIPLMSGAVCRVHHIQEMTIDQQKPYRLQIWIGEVENKSTQNG